MILQPYYIMLYYFVLYQTARLRRISVDILRGAFRNLDQWGNLDECRVVSCRERLRLGVPSAAG